MLADTLYQLRFIPLVHDDQVGAIQAESRSSAAGSYRVLCQVRIRLCETRERLFAGLRDQVLHAPGICGLAHADVDAPRPAARLRSRAESEHSRGSSQTAGSGRTSRRARCRYLPFRPVPRPSLRVYAEITLRHALGSQRESVARAPSAPALLSSRFDRDNMFSASSSAASSSGLTNRAQPCHNSRRLGISPSTRAHPDSAASRTDKPNGSYRAGAHRWLPREPGAHPGNAQFAERTQTVDRAIATLRMFHIPGQLHGPMQPLSDPVQARRCSSPHPRYVRLRG